jgi:hypothetical protein
MPGDLRRKLRPWFLLIVAIILVVRWYLRDRPAAAVDAPRAGSAVVAPSVVAGHDEGTAALVPAAADAAAPASRSDARARRDALRDQIARQLAQRPAPPPQPAPLAGSTGDGAPGGLRDRTGSRQALVDQLNRDFMPLASECIEQAQARTPALAGLLAIGVETMADEQLGAVVDVADRAPGNKIEDPLLFECLRESAFSLSLPPPPSGGREKFQLTIPVDAATGAATGSGTGSAHR